MTTIEHIPHIVARQRAYFHTHATRDIKFRKAALRALRAAILLHEQELAEALYLDLHKSYEEAYLTEISILLGEIESHLENLDRWTAPSKKKTPLKLFKARSMVITEPLGVALIIAPWNYPVQLLLNPLIGAISAGCTAVLKPSPYVPNVSRTLKKLIDNTFQEEYISIIEGHRDINEALLRERYDVIFFTGSPTLGRTVMRAAAENLTPVILELGGKSPVVIDSTANVELAAHRIAWGKSLNAGQTCIAPDYLLLHSDIKERFIEAYGRAIRKLHGENVAQSKHYVRMVSDAAYQRVIGYMSDGVVRFGGGRDAATRYIEPTLLDNVSPESRVMQEEIFGPILPIVEISSMEEAETFINNREKPLALYIFAEESKARRLLNHTSSGGACINDVIMHIANEHLPFGGVGNSGMGRYHGRDSLYSFSHRRAVLQSSTKIDLPFRYMPYRFFRWIKRIL